MKIVNLNAFRYVSIVIFATIALITYVINYEYTQELNILNQVKDYQIEAVISNNFLSVINECEMYYENKLINYQIKEVQLNSKTSTLIVSTNRINDYMFVTKCRYGKTTIKDEIYKFLKEGMIQWKN